MRKGRPLVPLSISVEDRAQLVAWSKRPRTAQALAEPHDDLLRRLRAAQALNMDDR